jgi:hypothetical protein
MLDRALGSLARPAALSCLLAPAGLAQGSTLVQTLTGQQIGDLFGTASAVSGDRAAVRNSGRIDLFERSNGLWSPLQSIPIDNPEGGAGLGLPLYLGPDFLAVGLPYGIVGGINSGLVRIYRPTPSGYQLEQTLLPEQPLIGAFGWSMAREGQRLAVGAPFYQQGFQSHGAVFVFETGPGTWPQAQAIRASDSKNQDNFGFSIDIEGDRLVAGARLHDAGTSNSGAVYVFERQGGAWVQIQKLLSPEPVIGGEFGRSLALDGGTLVVGSLRAETGNGLKSGAAFLFTQTPEGYQLDSKLVQAIPGDGDGFGVSVALNGPLLAVGACYHDGAGQDDGAVYLYEQVAGWQHLGVPGGLDHGPSRRPDLHRQPRGLRLEQPGPGPGARAPDPGRAQVRGGALRPGGREPAAAPGFAREAGPAVLRHTAVPGPAGGADLAFDRGREAGAALRELGHRSVERPAPAHHSLLRQPRRGRARAFEPRARRPVLLSAGLRPLRRPERLAPEPWPAPDRLPVTG